jgi:hypothetical protein
MHESPIGIGRGDSQERGRPFLTHGQLNIIGNNQKPEEKHMKTPDIDILFPLPPVNLHPILPHVQPYFLLMIKREHMRSNRHGFIKSDGKGEQR